MKVQPVSTDHIASVWPEVEGFITSALRHSKGDYSAEHAKVYLADGRWSLIVASDDEAIKGATIINYINMPNDRVAFIIAIGGKLISTPDLWSQFTDILRYNGATKIEGAARGSIARLWALKFKFTEKYRIIEVSL
jgi:hypothetical protein